METKMWLKMAKLTLTSCVLLSQLTLAKNCKTTFISIYSHSKTRIPFFTTKIKCSMPWNSERGNPRYGKLMLHLMNGIKFFKFHEERTIDAIKKAANLAFKTIEQHLTQLLYSFLSRIFYIYRI